MINLLVAASLFTASITQTILMPSRTSVTKGEYNHALIPIIFRNLTTKVVFFFQQSEKIKTDPPNMMILPSQTYSFLFFPVFFKNITTEKTLTLAYNISNDNYNTTKPLIKGQIVFDVETPQKTSKDLKIVNIKTQGKYIEILLSCPTDYGILHYILTYNGTKADPFGVDYVKTNEKQRMIWKKSNQIKYSLLQRNSTINFFGQMKIQNQSPTLKFQTLLTEDSSYNICLIYENKQTNQFSNSVCKEFKTGIDTKMIMLYFNFAQQIRNSKQSSLLCFFVDYLDMKLDDIVTMSGMSCNIQYLNRGSNYNYQTRASLQPCSDLIIYIQTTRDINKNAKTFEKVKEFFDENNNLSQRGKQIFEQNQIDWILSGKYLGIKNVDEMLNVNITSLDYNVTGTTRQILNNKTNITTNFLDITAISSFRGVLYICLVEITEITLKEAKLITPNSLTRGLAGTQKLFKSFCRKMELTKLSPEVNAVDQIQKMRTSIQIPSYLNQNKKIYFTATNQYPRYPIVQKQIRSLIAPLNSINEGEIYNQKVSTSQGDYQIKQVKDSKNVKSMKENHQIILALSLGLVINMIL